MICCFSMTSIFREEAALLVLTFSENKKWIQVLYQFHQSSNQEFRRKSRNHGQVDAIGHETSMFCALVHLQMIAGCTLLITLNAKENVEHRVFTPHLSLLQLCSLDV